MEKCCFYCGKLFRESAHRAKQKKRGAFVLLQAFLTDCLWPLCMLRLFMSLVDAAVWSPWACYQPKNLLQPRFALEVPEIQRTYNKLLDRNSAFRNVNYKTDAFSLTQLSPSETAFTAKQRVVLVLWIILHLHFQFPALRLFSFFWTVGQIPHRLLA